MFEFLSDYRQEKTYEVLDKNVRGKMNFVLESAKKKSLNWQGVKEKIVWSVEVASL